MPRRGQSEWHELVDPDGSQKQLYESTRNVYEELFSGEHTESWSHVRQYVLDARMQLRRDPRPECIDHCLIGTVDGDPRGIALLTTYLDPPYAFCSYLGVTDARHRPGKELASTIYLALRKILARRSSRWVVFEVEKQETLESSDSRWRRERLAFLDQIYRLGARKLVWVDYKQPHLDLRQPRDMPVESNLHLMVAKVTKGRPDPGRSIPRSYAEDIVRFVYKRFYLDAFEVTDPGQIREAEERLEGLAQEVLNGIPRIVREIPLGLVRVWHDRTNVFISYTPRDVEFARLVRDYLRGVGVATVTWDEEFRAHAGDQVNDVTRRWVEASDIVVAIITPNVLEAWGVIKEVDYAHQIGKHVVPLLAADLGDPDERERLQKKLSGLLPGVIYMPFRTSEFHRVPADLERMLLRSDERAQR